MTPEHRKDCGCSLCRTTEPRSMRCLCGHAPHDGACEAVVSEGDYEDGAAVVCGCKAYRPDGYRQVRNVSTEEMSAFKNDPRTLDDRHGYVEAYLCQVCGAKLTATTPSGLVLLVVGHWSDNPKCKGEAL